MPYSFKLSRRIVCLRVPVFAALALALGCDSTDSFEPAAGAPLAELPATPEIVSVGGGATAAATFAGGIPMGTYALPTSEFGNRYNGGMRTIATWRLRSELSAIKQRGGKVVLNFTGNPRYYRDGSGNFSLSKWKARMDRFRNVEFDSYVSDGTILGHYLIDEPNDPANWSGRPVPPSTLEEMAAYSKQRWPNLTTIVRVDPSYLSQNHRHLDAAWAQYLSRRGNVNDYIRRVVSDAQDRGLGLVVGLNIIKGGTPNGTKMTGSEIKTWGSALLSSTYPCAFLSWQYQASYLSENAIEDAMDYLRNKAENRGSKSCRG